MIKLKPDYIKIVNIYPDMPITSINPPIRSTVRKVRKTVSDIKACLMRRAIVEEIMPNGNTVRLTLSNYDVDLASHFHNNSKANTTTVANKKDKIKVEEKVEVKEEAPKKEVKEEVVKEDTKKNEEWEAYYNKALEGVDLLSMTRKQRRAAEAKARAAADEAINNKTVDPEETTEKTEDVTTSNITTDTSNE